MTITDVVPAPGAQDVPTTVAPAVTFSDFPDPDTVGVATMVLTTSVFRYTGRYMVDLLDRRVSLDPAGIIGGGNGYTLTVGTGIRSLRGCALVDAPGPDGQPSPSYYFRFHTLEPGDAPDG